MTQTTISYADKRVLVTGGSGFIGSHLTSALLNLGAQVLVVDNRPSPLSGDARTCFGDLRDTAFITQNLQGFCPNVIFHLAGYKERSSTIESFQDSLSNNLVGTLNLLTAAQRGTALESVVLMGTAEEYGSNETPFREEFREAPVTAYSLSKVCVTHLSLLMQELYGLPCIVLRPTVVYGPGQMPDMFLPALIQSVIAGVNFPMTSGEQTRDFLFVTDLVEALLAAGLSRVAVGHVINIGSGAVVTISALGRKVEQLLGKEGLIQLGALPYRAKEIMEYGVCLEKASKLLGWKARFDLESGLKLTIDFYRRNAGL